MARVTLHQRPQVEDLLRALVDAAFDARHGQQLADQLVEAVGLAFDSIQMAEDFRVGLLAREAQRHVQPRQRPND